MVDPRAYLWTADELARFERGIGLRRGGLLVDMGCGWGALGLALARRNDRLRVVGLDLDTDLLVAGRQVTSALGLGSRVRLIEQDAQRLDDWTPTYRGAAVACQAFLVHLPRPARWLAELAAALPAGTRIGAVEKDIVASAGAVRDSVTDGDAGYAAGRLRFTRAVVRGGVETLGVDRRLGRSLDRVFEAAGLVGVRSRWLPGDACLAPPYDVSGSRGTWFESRFARRLVSAGADPVDRSLAEAGGLSAEQCRSWFEQRRAADRARLRALRQGTYSRSEGAGTRACWGVVSPG